MLLKIAGEKRKMLRIFICEDDEETRRKQRKNDEEEEGSKPVLIAVLVLK